MVHVVHLSLLFPIHSFLIPLQIKEVHFSKSCGQVNGNGTQNTKDGRRAGKTQAIQVRINRRDGPIVSGGRARE